VYKFYKEMESDDVNSLIDKDIPRTFPHLNELFEEI
jgi:hypothetical protein